MVECFNNTSIVINSQHFTVQTFIGVFNPCCYSIIAIRCTNKRA